MVAFECRGSECPNVAGKDYTGALCAQVAMANGGLQSGECGIQLMHGLNAAYLAGQTEVAAINSTVPTAGGKQ